ncbi:hypothetical protein BDU57DRAFT_159251 [Ampelomyces quisqualis]|uniref:Uncharacterized protein n=1 Tax=Ampelomyces quisqualis TaxID=50730 RepID=A0A6A5QTK0_AMPQU|nr:hypothetical protein BDU57DRAFT_159251 [Ampelomyces quisqualis]
MDETKHRVSILARIANKAQGMVDANPRKSWRSTESIQHASRSILHLSMAQYGHSGQENLGLGVRFRDTSELQMIRYTYLTAAKPSLLIINYRNSVHSHLHLSTFPPRPLPIPTKPPQHSLQLIHHFNPNPSLSLTLIPSDPTSHRRHTTRLKHTRHLYPHLTFHLSQPTPFPPNL